MKSASSLIRSFATIRAALNLIQQASLNDYKILVAAVAAQACALPLMLFIVKLIIDSLVSSDVNFVWHYLLAEVGVVALLVICRQEEGYRQDLIRDKLVVLIRTKVNGHYASMAYSKFDDPAEYDNLSKIRNNVYYGPLWIVVSITSIGREAISVLVFVAIMAVLDPILIPFTLLALVPAILLSRNAGYVSYSLHDLSTRDGRLSAYYDEILTERDYAKEVRVYGLAGILSDNMNGLERALLDKKAIAYRKKHSLLLKSDLVIFISQYIPVFYSLFAVLDARLTLGAFVYIAMASRSLRQNISALGSHVAKLVEQSKFFEHYEIMSQIAPINPPPEKSSHSALTPSIHFDNVTFQYPGSENEVLKNVTFTVPAGQTTALVGLNGSGKSTVVKLISKLYSPVSGRIIIEGIDLNDISSAIYYQQLSVVFQDFARYSFNIMDNISISRCFIRDEKILNAVEKITGIQTLVNELSKGWETHLGREFDEDGIDLSGGQWQKIAIARAIYGSGTIFLMDEPTSALDIETEMEMFNKYAELTQGRTSLVITHRFSTVRFAHNIVVLEQGRVVETGTWGDLLAKKGKFYSLYTKQMEMHSPTPVNPDFDPLLRGPS